MMVKKDEKSPWAFAYEIISRAYEDNKQQPLTRPQISRLLQSTPGLLFSTGSTTDSILEVLEGWRCLRIDRRDGKILTVQPINDLERRYLESERHPQRYPC